MKNKRYYLNLAKEIARIADSKKGENITVYDVESKTGIFYYAILINSLSSPHTKALEEEIITSLKKEKNEYILHRDGIKSPNWKVLDYDGVIVHIFEPSIRDFYGLDRIYLDCKKVKWQKNKTTKNKNKRENLK
jgi:ribosome-associated protein